MVHTKRTAAGSAILTAVLVSASALHAPTAQAEGGALGIRSHTSTPMKIVGFDAKVAEAHGYRIVTVNGKQYSILKRASSKPSPMKDVAYGDCGSSYVDAYRASGRAYVSVSTGYSVYETVAYKAWSVTFNSFSDGGVLSFPGNNTGHTWNSGVQAYYIKGKGLAHVSVGSHATLINGAVCYSGTPIDPYS